MIKQIPFTLVDIGASGGIQDKWRGFAALNFYGFEPDSRGVVDVRKNGRETWITCGVAGTSGTFNFNLLREQCNSSLLKPNLHTISQLAYDIRDFDLIRQIAIPCETLNEICSKLTIDPDMIKLDTQGSEFEILEGGLKVLDKSILAAEIEVEFLPLYENQKLFADVDSFMRAKGFVLMDLGNQLYVKGKHSEKLNQRKGFLVAADALYFRSIETLIAQIDTFTVQKLLSLLPICKAYGYLNFAFELFSEIKNKRPDIYAKLSTQKDVLSLITSEIPKPTMFNLSERKYASVRAFFEKRIKNRNANWNYGLGNPAD